MPSRAFAFSHSGVNNHMVLWGVSIKQQLASQNQLNFNLAHQGGTRRMLPSPYSIRFHICDCSTKASSSTKDPHQFLAGRTTPTTLICIQITSLFSSRDNRIQRFFTGDIMNKRNVVVSTYNILVFPQRDIQRKESNLKKMYSFHCSLCLCQGFPFF